MAVMSLCNNASDVKGCYKETRWLGVHNQAGTNVNGQVVLRLLLLLQLVLLPCCGGCLAELLRPCTSSVAMQIM